MHRFVYNRAGLIKEADTVYLPQLLQRRQEHCSRMSKWQTPLVSQSRYDVHFDTVTRLLEDLVHAGAPPVSLQWISPETCNIELFDSPEDGDDSGPFLTYDDIHPPQPEDVIEEDLLASWLEDDPEDERDEDFDCSEDIRTVQDPQDHSWMIAQHSVNADSSHLQPAGSMFEPNLDLNGPKIGDDGQTS